MSDLKDIIVGCTRHDSMCQRKLYERYYGYALKTVFRYIFKYEIAVDVVNDGFVKLLSHFEQFKAEDTGNTERILMGWIRRIMINNAIDELRRHNMILPAGNVPESVWQEADATQNADQLLYYKDLIKLVGKLPPVYRAVFNMHVIDGLSHQEIANILGIAVGTSKSNLFKAKNLLQTYIKEQERKSEICRM